MKITKLISIALIFALFACTLMGCGSDKEENTGGDTLSQDVIKDPVDKNEEDKEEVFRGIIDSVSVSDDIILARSDSGKAYVVGGNTLTGNMNTAAWEDIVAVSAGSSHIVGLRADGTVIASGNGGQGQTNVGSWEDIVAIHAGLHRTYGLKSDGTVIVTNSQGGGYSAVEGWKDIVTITGCGDMLWGLTEGGDVYTVSEDEPVYSGVKSIESNSFFALFVMEDGTVAVDPKNEKYANKVSGIRDWKNVTYVSSLVANHTAGLLSDGTVVAAGENDDGRCDVSEWKDIVAIATGSYHTVGLRSDGTVVAAGGNGYGQCDVSEWKDIVAIYASDILTVGLKADGTLVAAGQVWNGLDGIESIRDVATK